VNLSRAAAVERDVVRFRPRALAATLLALSTLSGCGLLVDDAPTQQPPATATTTPASPAPPSDDATALLLGPWRPAPAQLPEELLSSAEEVCRSPEDPVLVATIRDVPIVVADARGGGLANLIFANDNVAFECRVKLELVGPALGATILAPPSWLAPSGAAPDGVTIVSNDRVEDDGSARTVLIGRVKPQPYRTVAGFDDQSEVVASQGGGWFTAWWPGLDRPGAVAAVDRSSVAQASAADPHQEVEGRATLAKWWVDPGAPAPGPDSTTIHALVQEQVCASGRPPDGRVLEPGVFYGPNGVLVTFLVRRQPGGQDCQGTGPAAFDFTLSQPLGDRKLLDGGEIPPRDASAPPD
jgi:hypothetical protein